MPYNDPNSAKDAARKKAIRAVYRGMLPRPDRCEGCLRLCTPDAHHNDYSKPLDVHWLCKTCHGEVHGFYAGIYNFDLMFGSV